MSVSYGNPPRRVVAFTNADLVLNTVAGDVLNVWLTIPADGVQYPPAVLDDRGEQIGLVGFEQLPGQIRLDLKGLEPISGTWQVVFV